MRKVLLAVAGCLAALLPAGHVDAAWIPIAVWDFESDPVGGLPSGWTWNRIGVVGVVDSPTAPGSTRSVSILDNSTGKDVPPGLWATFSPVAGVDRYKVDYWYMRDASNPMDVLRGMNVYTKNDFFLCRVEFAGSVGYRQGSGWTTLADITAGQWYHLVYDIDVGQNWDLYLYDASNGLVASAFDIGWAYGGTTTDPPADLTFNDWYCPGEAGKAYLDDVTVSVIPEPCSVVLWGTGLCICVAHVSLRRRRLRFGGCDG